MLKQGRRLFQQIGCENVTTADINTLITVEKTDKNILAYTNNFRSNSLQMTGQSAKAAGATKPAPPGGP